MEGTSSREPPKPVCQGPENALLIDREWSPGGETPPQLLSAEVHLLGQPVDEADQATTEWLEADEVVEDCSFTVVFDGDEAPSISQPCPGVWVVKGATQ